MNLLYLTFLSIVPVFISCEEPASDIQTLNNPPILKKPFITFLFAMGIILMVYFAFSTIMSLSCCIPESSDDPGCISIILHFFCGTFLLITSILFYVGTSKVKMNDEEYYYPYQTKNQTIAQLLNIIENPFQQVAKHATNLYKNITVHDEYSKSLREITINYNTTFSDIDYDYRVHFNNIYSKLDTSNYLKYLLKSMDVSRNSILTQILTIITKYNNISNSIKNTLKSYHSNYFTATEEANKKLHKKLNKIADDLNKRKPLGSKSYDDAINIIFANVVSTGILLFAVAYSIIFFFQNGFSRCCFCSYSIWALLILLGSFLCGFLTIEKKYKSLTNICSGNRYNYYSSTFSEKKFIKTEIEKALFEFKERKKSIKNELNLNEYDFNFNKRSFELIDSMINSKSVHSNFETVYFQYASNDVYKSDLNAMISIIKKNDKTLKKMSSLFKNITDFAASLRPSLLKIQSANYSIIDNEKENDFINDAIYTLDMNSQCNKLITGFNVLIIADLFLIVGLVLMSISVCIRRVNMKSYYGVSNEGKSASDDDDDGMRSVNLGVQTVGAMVTVNESGEPDISFLNKSANAKWGDGIYTSKNEVDAFKQFCKYYDGRVNVDQFYWVQFEIDFHKALDVPVSSYSKFKLPKSLEAHDCLSVIGHNPDGSVDYVLYFTEHIKEIAAPTHIPPEKILMILNNINNENQSSSP